MGCHISLNFAAIFIKQSINSVRLRLVAVVCLTRSQFNHFLGPEVSSHLPNVQVPATAMSWGSPSLGCFPQTSPPGILFTPQSCGPAHHLVQEVKSEQCLKLSLHSRKQNFCFLLKIFEYKNPVIKEKDK